MSVSSNTFWIRTITALSLAVVVGLSSCGLIPQDQVTPPLGDIPTATPEPMAETIFDVALPAPIPDGSTLSVAILDEVTGLPVNPVYYPLQAVDATHYSAHLALPLKGVVKYRYVLQSATPIQEDTAFDQPVRYRMYYVPGPGQLADVISSWTDQQFSGPTGKIQGQVLDPTSGKPLSDILVTAGGATTMTDSLGNFVIDGLPAGTHNLVAYSLDGAYQTFQQGAVVAPDAMTPAAIAMKPAQKVKVTFVVTVPADTVAGAPLKMAGNLLQLGNTFGDLDGGLSTMSSQMPVLTPLTDGRYSITLDLPAGANLQYKYTQGDGLWNAEFSKEGSFRLRQIIVPDQSSVIQDQVDTWATGGNAPIFFEVTVPSTTPSGDTISIQFNPYAWTVPIPMWPIGNNHWVFKLFNPLGLGNSIAYRYCRNDQCGSADDSSTAGQTSQGRSATLGSNYQEISDTVSSWQWEPVMTDLGAQPIINKRPQGFITGMEIQPSFHPSWMPFMPEDFLSLKDTQAEWAILTPTWTVLHNNPLIFAQQPGVDALRSQIESQVASARAANLNVAIFPNPHFEIQGDDWRYSTPADWNEWFDRYRSFVLYNADVASSSGAQTLVIGGEWIPPTLFDGSSDAETRFRSLMAEIRQHFTGQIWWGQPYSGSMQASPPFLDTVDGIYLLWSAPLSQNPNASIDEMAIEAGRKLDADVLPFAISIQKPVIVAAVYPSAAGAITGCVPAPEGGCVDWTALSRPMPDIPSVAVDLQGQTNAYQALLAAVNDRPWLSGFVSRGNFPPAALADKAASVQGKPTLALLKYWFAQMLGLGQ